MPDYTLDVRKLRAPDLALPYFEARDEVLEAEVDTTVEVLWDPSNKDDLERMSQLILHLLVDGYVIHWISNKRAIREHKIYMSRQTPQPKVPEEEQPQAEPTAPAKSRKLCPLKQRGFCTDPSCGEEECMWWIESFAYGGECAVTRFTRS